MNYLERLKDINVFLFDVDGVFTDNRILLTESGELLRTMNIRDGYAVKRALAAGYKVGIITGGTSEGVSIRLRNLGITAIYSGVQKKIDALDDFLEQQGVSPLEVLYLGDDLPDLEVMQRVAVAVCPADAVHEVREVATFVSSKNGGDGCVREIIEKVMRLKDEW